MPTPREQLARTLRRARIDAGYGSHVALARKMNVSRPVISKAENPAQPIPSDEVMCGWSEATGVPIDQLRDLATRSKSGSPEWFVPYELFERSATAIRCWSPMVVPGLLQTEAYARAVLAVERYAPERLRELVSARMERQQVIGKAHLTVVIDAGVLSRCFGSAAIMAEQCAHLGALAERPDVAIHVVPEGVNMGTTGAFDIASHDGNFTVRMTALQDVTSTAIPLVELATYSFERLLGVAISLDESLNFIRESEESWKARM